MSEASLTSYDLSLSKNAQECPPKLIQFQKIESVIQNLLSTREGIEEILSSQQEALRMGCTSKDSESEISRLPIQTLGQPPQPTLKCGEAAQVCIKTGYKQGGDVMVCKIAAGGDGVGNTGAVLVFNQITLRLSAILCDEGLLTEVRTAAACVFSSRMMLSMNNNHDLSSIKKIGIIGGGVQAVWQLRFLGAMLNENQKNVVIRTQSKESAGTFIEKMTKSSYLPDREWSFEYYETITNGGKGFMECQLIHTLTPARSPVLFLEDISVGGGNSSPLHITCVGADSQGKCEIDPKIIQRANCLLCDSIPQSKERGEFQSSRNLDYNNLIEIGSIVDNDEFNSFCSKLVGDDDTNNDKPFLSIFDSSGLAIQDVEIADLISKHL